MNTLAIPTLNLLDFRSDAKKEQFVEDLGNALIKWGFFALENHGIDKALIQQGYQLNQVLFQKSDETKREYEDLKIRAQRGFTSYGREHAKGQKVPDLKEFWHVGRENLGPEYPQNIWPNEEELSLQGFETVFNNLFDSLDQCALTLLQACSLYLGEEDNRISEIANGGNSILRLIHYPPVDPKEAHPDSIRAAAHEDINLITLLCEATEPGLELLDRNGEWLPIECKPGQIIVDSGDMLENLTNGIFRSTTHRVIRPKNDFSRRFSMPFFVHPRKECDLDPLESCLQRCKGKQLFPKQTAGEFLEKRLGEIGL